MSERKDMKRSMSQDNDLIVVKKKAKQSPTKKAEIAASSSKKRSSRTRRFIRRSFLWLKKVKKFNPDVMIAIGGGGFIPARILRTVVKIPILAVSLELYDDSTSTMKSQVKKVQWFDEKSGVGRLVRGKRVLVVDEVDDTRTTLQYCCEELIRTNRPAAIAVAVVHNKLKEKKGTLPKSVEYMAGADVPNRWNCYPWDAESYGHSIYDHEHLAATRIN